MDTWGCGGCGVSDLGCRVIYALSRVRGVDGGHLLEDHRVVLPQVVGDALAVLVRLGVPELRRVVVRHVVVLAPVVVLPLRDHRAVRAEVHRRERIG